MDGDRELHYRWEWDLHSTREALWPLVADTNRFNRDAGVPAVEEQGVGRNARRRLRLSLLGVGVEWEEEPFEWVEPHRFSVIRRYVGGPIDSIRVAVELQPREGGGTRLVYDVWARPRNLLGRLAVPVQIGLLSRRRFEAAFRRYDEIASAGSASLEEPRRVRLVPGGERRLETARERLAARPLDADLLDRLVVLIARGDELTLARLRPYALADAWAAKRRAVLELCLHATRAGVLELQWELLCPLCRGAKETTETLDGLASRVHCDTCNIDFSADFERSVELTFRPNAAIRIVEQRKFCVGGPQVTPHVVAQQLLPPGVERALELSLDPGRYRLRTLDGRETRWLLVTPEGRDAAEVHVADEGNRGELHLRSRARLRLENAAADEQLIVLERAAWSDQAATAAEVTALQVFRDLFASEALRPGEPISVGTLTVVFTDLRGSTRFYREFGDAPAFGSVMDHLDVLRDAVVEEDGAVVKAMGDAIMAVFRRPLAAMRAAVRAQRELASPDEGRMPLFLKVGIHSGPCIAINQNGRLDYFGSTVNVAARLVGLSSGEDIVVSGAVVADPEVGDELRSGDVAGAGFEAELRGFEGERFELFRVTAPTEGPVRA